MIAFAGIALAASRIIPEGRAAGGTAGIVSYVACFLLVSFVVALVTSAIRPGPPGRTLVETRKFFITIVLVILVFAAVVQAVEWVFIGR